MLASTARVTISRPSLSVEPLVSAVDRHAGTLKRSQKLGAQALRLRKRAPRQFAAAHAGRKAKIVFDARTGAGLPARRMAIEQQRAQPF